MKKLTLLLLSALLLTATACGGAGLGGASSVKTQLEEARTLNSELSAEWTSTETMLNDTQKAIENFPKIDIDKSKLDVALLKEAMVECFNSPLAVAKDTAMSGDMAATGEKMNDDKMSGEKKDEMVKDEMAKGATASVAKCEGGEKMSALNDLKGQSDPEVTNFIDNKLGSVAMIKANLKAGLPGKAENLVKRVPEAKIELEKIRATAQGVKAIFDKNPLNNDAAKKKFAAEYTELEAELKAIDELLSNMQTEVPNLPGRVTETGVNFQNGLSSFGQ